MPTVLLKRIYYVSSQDTGYPASNLLGTVGKKWKCKESGEKSINVILELDEPTVITGLDIGNEHSAYVQVLVNNKGGNDSDYEELLLTSSFMTPLESRNSTNPNRVRCFSDTTLVEDVAEKKWNLVKIICTQPYNKHAQYGLSFVKLYGTSSAATTPAIDSQSSNASTSSTHSKVISLGKFKMREESPETSDSESLTSTSLFSRWKNTGTTTSQHKTTAAAEIKNASASLSSSARGASPSFINKNRISDKKNTSISILDTEDDGKPSKKSRNMTRLFYDDDDDDSDSIPTKRLETKLEKDKLAKEKEKLEKEKELKAQKDKKEQKHHQSKGTEEKMKNSVTKFKTFIDEKDDRAKPSTSGSTSSSSRDKNISPTPDKPATPSNSSKHREKDKPTSSRDKPVTPSSSSKPRDRDNRTPKRHSSPSSRSRDAVEPKKPKLAIEPNKIYKPFNKLMQGITLTISGIQNPERSDLRQKAVDMGARYKPDWDDNCTHLICAFKNTPKYNQVKQADGKIVSKKWIHDAHDKRIKSPWRHYALDSYDRKLQDSDEEIHDEKLQPKKPAVAESSGAVITPSQSSERSDSNILGMYDKSPEYDSGEDTEEEIERVKKDLLVAKQVAEPNNNYDLSTDDELNPNTQTSDQTKLAFFKGIRFYLNGDTIPATDLVKLKHLIEVYRGELCEEKSKSDFILSNKRVIKPERFTGEVIKPLWIFECHDMESKLPIKRYKFDS